MRDSSHHQYRVLSARPYGSTGAFRPCVFQVVFGGGLLMGSNCLDSGDRDNIAVWLTRDGRCRLLAVKRSGQALILETDIIKVRLSERGSFVIDEKSIGLKDNDSLDILPFGEKPHCAL